jgi:hypothetical protein
MMNDRFRGNVMDGEKMAASFTTPGNGGKKKLRSSQVFLVIRCNNKTAVASCALSAISCRFDLRNLTPPLRRSR